MQKTKIVNLGVVRDLLAEWERVRDHIIAGEVSGWFAAFRDQAERETVFLGGVYRDNSHEAVKVAMKVSAARTLVEDEPPLFQASRY